VRVIQRALGLRFAGEASVHEFTIDQPRVIGHDVELGEFRLGSEPHHRHELHSQGWVGSGQASRWRR
jgi:hypothetical protein